MDTNNQKTRPDFLWSFLAHFGMNMWGDAVRPARRDGMITRQLTDEEFALLDVEKYRRHDHVRFDEDVWQELSAQLKADGCNQIVIDVGEFLRYPSHPELAVEGSWAPERLRAEVVRLNAMGFEVVPKLNFSTCHDAWLGSYARQVSTPEYYKVCSDVIGDTLEVFKGTRFLHLGMDEEDIPSLQKNCSMMVMRQGELWWHDFNWLVEQVENHGVRAWVWHDYLRRHSVEEMVKRMPRSALMSPWTYMKTGETALNPRRLDEFKRLADAGYDVVPCSSNCYGGREGFGMLTEWSRRNLAPAHFKGMLMAPWMMTAKPYRRLLLEASACIKAASLG